MKILHVHENNKIIVHKSIDDVMQHYIKQRLYYMGLRKEYLIEALKKLRNSDAKYAFSCTSMPFPIQRTFKINNNGRSEMFFPEFYESRSQDLDESYQDAGQFYWINREKQKVTKNNRVIFSEISMPIVLPRHLVQDIDTLEDWKYAEKLYSLLKSNQKDIF